MKTSLEIKGYAAIFGTRDLAGDVIEKGSFVKSLQSLPAKEVRLLYQHDQSRPIGTWVNAFEDEIGLFVEGVLHGENPDSRLAIAMVHAKQMDGLSIGFRTLEFSRAPDGRILKQIDLREVSLVGFPMQPRARILTTNTSEAA